MQIKNQPWDNSGVFVYGSAPTETGSQIITLFACLSPALLASAAVADTSQDHQSAAYKRFRGSKLRFKSWNEFETDIRYTEVAGIDFEKGVIRRDQSGVIKVGDLYYVWYTPPPTHVPRVRLEKAKENPNLRAYHWDLSEILYATSPDG